MRLISLRGDDRQRLTLHAGDDVRSAMRRMNDTGRTLLLVTDPADADRFVGVVADGDIRRYLSRGGTADDPIDTVVNRTPTTLPHSTALPDIRAFMARRGFEAVPLVDGQRVAALCILERAPSAMELSAVVMAGGLGSRLAPLTDNCPKPLLRVGGKPILSHIVEHLREQGIHRFTFSVNYLSDMIVDYYDDGSRLECFIDYLHETQRLGTAGSLALLDREALSDPFLCVNGDILHDVDVGALHDTHLARGWDATMVVRNYHYPVPYGVVETHNDGSFVDVAEKPVHPFRINAGIYMLSHTVLDLVPRHRPYDLTTLFADLGFKGLRGGTFAHNGRWIDIGSTADYHRARSIFEDLDDNP